MQSSRHNRFRRLRAAGAACAMLILSGCMMQNQSAPPLSGPSGFGQALTLTATPDVMPRDGSSQSIIRVNFREGGTNEPLASRRLVLATSAGTLSAGEVVTDVGGNASFTLIAPSLNTPVSSASVSATLVGENALSSVSQIVRVVLLGPAVPTALFTTSPAVPAVGGAATYDASGTTLDGVECGPACSYNWDFGDGGVATGQVVQHTFQSLGVKVVTLTVTAPGGTVGTLSKSFSMATPTAPAAVFTMAKNGLQATFNASSSTVGAGASIVRYDWTLGDGVTAPDAGPIVFHTYVAGNYAVTLVITDSLGRTATLAQALTMP